MKRPKPLTSYAQNREDVLLARAFQPWQKTGFWIDVGAGHPREGSVTALFSDFGWRGLNIEPLEAEYALLCRDRPNDINVKVAVGSTAGSAVLYAGPPENRGMSTLVKEYGEALLETGFEKIVVPVVTLEQLVSEYIHGSVDFLKIDVEGYEASVLEGVDLRALRPTVIMVEATKPGTSTPSHEVWEPLIIRQGYRFALFDGLNRIYVSELADPSFLAALSTPVNVLDEYLLYETRLEIAAGLAATNSQLRLLDETISELEERLDRSNAYLVASQRRCADALEQVEAIAPMLKAIESRLSYQAVHAVTNRLARHPWLYRRLRSLVAIFFKYENAD